MNVWHYVGQRPLDDGTDYRMVLEVTPAELVRLISDIEAAADRLHETGGIGRDTAGRLNGHAANLASLYWSGVHDWRARIDAAMDRSGE